MRPTTTSVANEYDGSKACRPNNIVEIIRNGSRNGLLKCPLIIISATINTLPAPIRPKSRQRSDASLVVLQLRRLFNFHLIKKTIVVPQIVAVNLCDVVAFRLFPLIRF